MAKLVEEYIAALLKRHKLYLCLAESCTGGLISDKITNLPGSSEYYILGVCAYSYEAKKRLLGVSAKTLDQFGAVSAETVREMAIGVRQAIAKDFPLDSTVSLSVSGIAGPGGGLPSKPVGMVWIGLSSPFGSREVMFQNNGSRVENKKQFAKQALGLLLDHLNEHFLPKLNLLTTKSINGHHLPQEFTIGESAFKVIDYGRNGETPQGFTVHAKLTTEDVFELVFLESDKAWHVLRKFEPARSI